MCASTNKILCLDSFMLITDLTSVSELSRIHPQCCFEHTMIAFLLQPGIGVSWLKLYTSIKEVFSNFMGSNQVGCLMSLSTAPTEMTVHAGHLGISIMLFP